MPVRLSIDGYFGLQVYVSALSGFVARCNGDGMSVVWYDETAKRMLW